MLVQCDGRNQQMELPEGKAGKHCIKSLFAPVKKHKEWVMLLFCHKDEVSPKLMQDMEAIKSNL